MSGAGAAAALAEPGERRSPAADPVDAPDLAAARAAVSATVAALAGVWPSLKRISDRLGGRASGPPGAAGTAALQTRPKSALAAARRPVLDERLRQGELGDTAAHDDGHAEGTLAWAAAARIAPGDIARVVTDGGAVVHAARVRPWLDFLATQATREEELASGLALALAELERLPRHRAAQAMAGTEGA